LYWQSGGTSIFLFGVSLAKTGQTAYTDSLSMRDKPFFMQKQNDDINFPEPKRLNLELRDLNKTLAALAFPSIIENSLYSLVFFSDTLIVGWLRNENFLAAAALAGIMMFLFNAPFIALSLSATSIVSRSWGENAYETARKHAGCAMTISFVLAVLLLAAGLPFARQIIVFFGASEQVAGVGEHYLQILLFSCLGGLPMMVSNGMLRGMGNTYGPMLITAVMNVINIIVSIMLAFGIFAPKLGFYGVAWGTVIARSVGVFLSMALLTRQTGLGLRWKHFWMLKKNVLGRIWYLAMPALAERGLSSLSYVLFMKMVAHLGMTLLAAHNVAMQVEAIAFMPAWGLGIAATTITGQSIGAGRKRIAKIAVRRILIAAGVLTVAMGIFFALFGPHIASIFKATEQVVHLAGFAIRLAALELPFLAITFIFIGALRGAGDTKSPLYVSTVSTVVFRLGGVYLLCYVFGLGLAGVWLATAADWAARSLGLGWVFKREAWALLHKKEKARFEP
jgi:putative MATE family efflux protein